MASTAQNMLVDTLRLKGIRNEKVLDAIRCVPRHKFVPNHLKTYAYEDVALAIEHAQAISQPYIVAKMTEELLKTEPCSKVLEVGTGSGYQAAILSLLIAEVYSIERIKELYDKALKRLQQLNYHNIQLSFSDGQDGCLEQAPFDGIIVTAAANAVPKVLLEQLRDGGRLVIPVPADMGQELQVITRKGNTYQTELIEPVVFVPLISGTED